MVNAYLFFFRCLLLSLSGSKKERMVIDDLFNKFSYRYTHVERRSFLTPFRYLKLSLLLLTRTKKNEIESQSSSFVFDIEKRFLEGDKDYLTNINDQKYAFVFKNELANELNFMQKTWYALQLLLLFVFILPASWVRSNKANLSLILLELTEALLLARMLKKYNCEEIIMFSAFEKDTMFISLFLEYALGIRVSLIPSSNPLSTLYKNVICHTFIFTAPFQKIEYRLLKDNWFISATELWPPYGFNSIQLNDPSSKSQDHLSIGFVSSGMALREHLGHPSEYSDKDFLAEKKLVFGLKKMLDEIAGTTLLIYLHPLEKSNSENLEFSKTYYMNIFGTEVKFAPLAVFSKASFNLCSIAISVYSSTQIERLYGGYKTLFAPMGCLENFFSDNRLSSISVQSQEGLIQMLKKVLPMTDEDFFENYNLMDYRWDTYKKNLEQAYTFKA
jgi:hypothetical protein